MAKCSSCGIDNTEDNKFCKNCGKPLNPLQVSTSQKGGKNNARQGTYAAIALGLLILAVISLVPLVPHSYEVIEKIPTTAPRVDTTTTVATRTVLNPIVTTTTSTYFTKTTTTTTQQVLQQRNAALFTDTGFDLKNNNYLYRAVSLPSGRNVQIHFRASDKVDLLVFTKAKFDEWAKSGGQPNTEKSSMDIKEDTVGFVTAIDTTYVFVLWNSQGFLGIGTTVGVYDFSATSEWKEMVSQPTPVEAVVEKTQTLTSTTTVTSTTRVTEVITTTTTTATTTDVTRTRTETITVLQYLFKQ